jgi:SAM-dependent methyltransferase
MRPRPPCRATAEVRAWHDLRVTDQQQRYDRIAAGYARWWAPVLRPTAIKVLDQIEPAVADGGRHILDLGTGTATLAIEAVRRWPSVDVVGIDASSEMAAAARGEADRLLTSSERARFRTEVAFADELPFDDGAFDAAMSSFVLQLVPSRAAVMDELWRVLRPGARFAHVTWVRGNRAYRPDIEFDNALEDVGIEPREPDGRGGDFSSVDAAASGLRKAGFRGVKAVGGELSYAFDLRSYVGFMEEFDEGDLFQSLDPELRAELHGRLEARLRRLPAESFVLRLPVVHAAGVRP